LDTNGNCLPPNCAKVNQNGNCV